MEREGEGKRTSSSTETHLHDLRGDRTALLVAVLHVPFEVDVKKLEYQVQLLIRVYDIKKPVKGDEITSSAIKLPVGPR